MVLIATRIQYIRMNDCADLFMSSASSDLEIRDTVSKIRDESRYILCPHSATGVNALFKFLESSKLSSPETVVCMATAHPGKFVDEEWDEGGLVPILPEQVRQ